jgi:hypothetical protein
MVYPTSSIAADCRRRHVRPKKTGAARDKWEEALQLLSLVRICNIRVLGSYSLF